MRIIDADILSYRLLENHVAIPYARPLIERGVEGGVGALRDGDNSSGGV